MPQKSQKSPYSHRTGRRLALAAAAALVVAGCASPPARQAGPPSLPPTEPPSTQVYFYPARGQSAAQQDRDRYECYLWAKRQTGFDPSVPQLAPHQRLDVMPMPPPPHDTVAGAATGAVLGAVVAPYGKTGEGAAIGAVAGAILGAASDAARQEQADQAQAQQDRRAAERSARFERQVSGYRRAMAACLEGRGYVIR